MYQIFGQKHVANNGIATLPNWSYLKTGLRQNLDKVVRYYRDNIQAVQSDHLLLRLVQSFNVPMSLPLDRYMAHIEAISLNLSMALKMTSSIYRGQFFENVFYGGNYELVIASDLGFDYTYANKHWESLSPVTVLRHNVTDLDLRLPDGRIKNGQSGISVVLINIPMLALQYRAWTINQEIHSIRTGAGKRLDATFIHGYVLPNMLGTHLDQVLFNRLWKMSRDEKNDDRDPAHPFMLIDYTRQLDESFSSLLVNLTRAQQLNFGQMLQAIPCVQHENMLEAMYLPDIAPTYQVMWALSISRLPALEFLFEMAPGGPNQKNRQIVAKILGDIRNYRRNSIMKTLPPDMQEEINREMNFLVDQSGVDSNLAGPMPYQL